MAKPMNILKLYYPMVQLLYNTEYIPPPRKKIWALISYSSEDGGEG